VTFHKIIVGDAFDKLPTLESDSVNLVVTSPPYWGFRNYGADGQIGLEKTWQEYVEKLVKVSQEIKRILRKDGSYYLNLGDTYAGSGGAGGDYLKGGLREGQPKYKQSHSGLNKDNITKPKQKLLIPYRVAIALQEDGWICRNDITWHKPNAMPSSVKDRLNCTTERVFHFVKSRKYWYDLDAIREPHTTSSIQRAGRSGVVPFNLRIRDTKRGKKGSYVASGKVKELTASKEEIKDYIYPEKCQDMFSNRARNKTLIDPNARGLRQAPEPSEDGAFHSLGKNPGDVYCVERQQAYRHHGSGPGERSGFPNEHPLGSNPGDFWEINTMPFPDAHFAVYPEALVERIIKSSCPQWVCKKCGKARERIVKTNNPSKWAANYDEGLVKAEQPQKTSNPQSSKSLHRQKGGVYYSGEFVGWTSCDCNAGFDSGIVLDPFAGAFTSAKVARDLGRSSISIEIQPKYVEIAKKRLRIGEQLDTGIVDYEIVEASQS